MYIEELLNRGIAYEVRMHPTQQKCCVYQERVGCVFIGTSTDCSKYIAQSRSKQAIEAEMRRGRNPEVSR